MNYLENMINGENYFKLIRIKMFKKILVIMKNSLVKGEVL